jgi:transposase
MEGFMLIGMSDRKVWVLERAIDMRNGYDGLYTICRSGGFDIMNGDLFLFVSRDRRQCKILFWDGTGRRILMKKMERNLFAKIFDRGEISVTELELFLDGAKLAEKIVVPEKEKYIA